MMFQLSNKRWVKTSAVLVALMLAAVLPMSALAETSTDATTSATTGAANAPSAMQGPGRAGGFGGPGMNNGTGSSMGNQSFDETTLTDDQKAVYEKAKALYEQIEDAVLADLVSEGVVAQADVDLYKSQRASEESMTALDQSSWTAEQFKAYYEASSKSGDERKSAFQALVSAGQLTQAQADALCPENQENLWTQLRANESTNSAIQLAVSTMNQARQAYQQSLRDAGISAMPDMGDFDDGLGMPEGGPSQDMHNRNNGMDNRDDMGGPGNGNQLMQEQSQD